VPAHAVLVLTAGEEPGRRWTLPAGQRLLLGRARDAGIRLRDPDASRHHAAVTCTPQGVWVEDLGSSNGTFLGERRLAANQPQAVAQDVLRIGAHLLEVRFVGADAPAPARPAPPRLRDAYELHQRLGEGAAGTVYAARHRASGRPVAIKGLHANVSADPNTRERFLREGSIRLRHPHLVEVYETFDEGGCLYLVMEHVGGGCVRDLLHPQRLPVPLPVGVGVGLQAARGLLVLHEAGVVHRDIKPDNLLLTETGQVKVGDFGLAKQADQIESLTASGQGLGTLAYMPPEQATNAKRIGPSADLYSLGATLYHLVAGRPPFTTTTMEILIEILEAEPPHLAELRPDCPASLVELVHDLLCKDPDERPPETELVVEQLEEIAREVG
jgi:eukaryotic-like serine/threonine-protein kinase